MADVELEDDLRAMFASAPAAADADVFAERVQRRLDRFAGVRLALVGGLGLIGVLIAWLTLGLSLGDVSGALVQMTSAAATGAISVDDASGWAAAVLLLALGGLMVRPVLSET